MRLRACVLVLPLATASTGCGSGVGGLATPVTEPAPPPAIAAIEVGPGEVRAWAADGDLIALCTRGEPPGLSVADVVAGTVTGLQWPFDGSDGCDHLAIGSGRVCAIGYDAGLGCAPLPGGGPSARREDLPAPPTGIVWDGEAFWIATDGGGLWRLADGPPARVLDVPDLMSGIVAGAFGVTWGSGGEYAWRTRLLRRGATDPDWIRPRGPPGIECEREIELCEWLTTAIGIHGGRLYFAAERAPAPLYRMSLDDGRFEEMQVAGDVYVATFGVISVDFEGGVWLLDETGRAPEARTGAAARRSRGPRGWAADAPPPPFVDTGVRFPVDALPVASPSGLWAAGGGMLRLVATPEDLLAGAAR